MREGGGRESYNGMEKKVEKNICALENEFDDLIEAFMGPYK